MEPMAVPYSAIVALWLATLAASLPGAGGQAEFGVVPSHLLLEDPAGDVAAGSYSNPAASAAANYPTADLLSLSISETPSAVLLYVGLSAVPDESSPTDSQVRASYSLAFRYAEQDFVAYISGSPPGGATEEAYRGTFCKGTWAAQEVCMEDMHLAALPSIKSFGIQIPKAILDDLSGTPPTTGQTLGSWRAQAQLARPVGQDLWIGDHLNDPIIDDVAFTLQFGFPQTGPLVMSGEDLYIVSNGLATSYPFTINLANALNQAQTVRLAAHEVPNGWQVTLPDAGIHVAPASTQTVVIVLTVPFRHAHGSIERFIVEAQDDNGHPLANLDMGLIYTETPQPTGHHNVLAVHSFAGGKDGFLSTLQTDSGDSGEPIQGAMAPSATTLFDVAWELELQPGLAVGLDFDLLRTGTIEIPVFNSVDTPGMHLTGTLDLSSAAGTTTLATIVPAAAIDGRAQQTTTLQGTLEINPAADLTAYAEGSNMVLRLVLASNLGAWTPNDIMPGGTLTLPLFDYHDDVDATIATLSGLAWRSDATTDLRGSPGSDVVVPLVLESTNGQSRRIRVQVDSNPPGVASFIGPAEGVVDSNSVLEGQLVVKIPVDAADGYLLDAVVVAQDQAGSGALAVRRLVIIVDSSVAPSHFSPTDKPGMETPSPGLGAIFLVLVGALALRKRT